MIDIPKNIPAMKVQMKTCSDCGETIMGGIHPKSFTSVTRDDFEKLYHIRGKCCVCESRVSIETIKRQGIKNWRKMNGTTAFFCSYCSHLIEKSYDRYS